MVKAHEKMTDQRYGESKRKMIPAAVHSETVPTHGGSWDEGNTETEMPPGPRIRYTPTIQRAIDIPERMESLLTASPGIIAETSEDRFLKALGEILHVECWGMGEDEKKQTLTKEKIGELYRQAESRISEDLSQINKSYYIEALSHIPGYLFAEKDPDHPGEARIPDLRELLALDAYVARYEQHGLGMSLSGYHRGGTGQPDFVYKDESERITKKYDPLQLPREENIEAGRVWLEGAYDQHAGGKGTGAVCILDVSSATEEQLDNWIKIFGYNLMKITLSLTIASNSRTLANDSPLWEDLIHLCNTYAVSYREDAREYKIRQLQGIFDAARAFLKENPRWPQLEDWRRVEGSPPENMFDGLFD